MTSKPRPKKAGLSRIFALDYLRGFFIIVIIVDHLWRWPSLFQFISGRGELWASAAEGFVIISGLLVGYIRGYKNKNKPLKEIATLLISRGAMLYIWMIITTVCLVTASWFLDFKGEMAHIPIPPGEWSLLITTVLRLDYVHTLTHFLYLYAIFLVIAPAVIWLLRRNQAWIVAIVSILAWLYGVHYSIEWMQWQLLFFLPSIAGFYLESLLTRYYALSLPVRKTIRYGSIGVMLVTVFIAGSAVLSQEPGNYSNTLFSRDPISLGTIIISFVWFTGLLSLFQLTMPFLKKWLGWLLLPFGERSLTAYILHTIPLIACAYWFSESDNLIENTLLGVACVIATLLLVQIPKINKIIPR